MEMMTESSSMLQRSINVARDLVVSRNFIAALELLNGELQSKQNPRPNYDHVVHAEINRTFLVQGNYKLMPKLAAGGYEESTSHLYRDLMSVQHAFNDISRVLDVEGALETVATTFHKYKSAIDTESPHDCIAHYWSKLYGEGLTTLIVNHHDLSLARLVQILMSQTCHHEAIQLIQFHMEDSENLLLSAAVALSNGANVAASLYALQAARTYAQNSKVQPLRDHLSLLGSNLHHEASEENRNSAETGERAADSDDSASIESEFVYAKVYRIVLQQRYLTDGGTTAACVEELIRLSAMFRLHRDLAVAFEALEMAAELVDQIANLTESGQLGKQVHKALLSLCEENGDRLSELLTKFRFCDILAWTSLSSSEARKQRAELLASSDCQRLPFLQQHHKRQWAECLIARQLDQAKYHADMYLRYCQRCKGPEAQSLAENMRIQTLLQPERMSSERRMIVLENARADLNSSIVAARENSWHQTLIERLLLMVEVQEEICRLEGDDTTESAAAVIGILQDAADVATQTSSTSGEKSTNSELALLRYSARRLLDLGMDSKTSGVTIPAGHSESEHSQQDGDVMQNMDRVRYLQQLMFALHHGHLQLFKSVHDMLCRHIEAVAHAGNTLRQSNLLLIRGLVYYLLMQEEINELKAFWSVAGFDTYLSGSKKVLECFSTAARLKSYFNSKPDRASTRNTMRELSATQAYFNNAMERIYVDVALELCVSIGDVSEIWSWIQKSKARGLHKTLETLFPIDDIEAAKQILPTEKALSFDDLRYIQSASAYQLVFVDWICYDEHPTKMLFFSCRIVGHDCHKVSTELDIDVDDMRDAAERISDATMKDSEAESRYLSRFKPLIAPLVECSKPGDILILSPTSPFQNVPLHAVTVEKGPLIERNPVVYTASHHVLRNILSRLEAPDQNAKAPDSWQPAVFGCYEDNSKQTIMTTERERIYRTLEELSRALDTEAILGGSVTERNFKDRAAGAELLHFHGHALHDPHEPSSQCLILGSPDIKLTMSDITSLNLRAAHVTLLACSGGVQDFSLPGDEPFGLITAFMLGGAASVVAALWPIQSSAGRDFTDIFYRYFIRHVDRREFGPIVNLARALQHTVLKMRKTPQTSAPYYWAPFVLHGNWFCRRKPGSW